MKEAYRYCSFQSQMGCMFCRPKGLAWLVHCFQPFAAPCNEAGRAADMMILVLEDAGLPYKRGSRRDRTGSSRPSAAETC